MLRQWRSTIGFTPGAAEKGERHPPLSVLSVNSVNSVKRVRKKDPLRRRCGERTRVTASGDPGSMATRRVGVNR